MSAGAPARRFERNQYVMTATVFVVFTGFAFVIPFLPLFVRELGVAGDARVALWSGVLIGVTPLLAGLTAPLWGRLADQHGQKPVAVSALSAYVVGLLLTAGVRDVWQLLALRVALGLVGGIGPLGLAMATAGAPRDQTGRAVGLIQSAQILSAAVGPLTGGLLADTIGMRRSFVATAAACLLALLLVLRFYVDAGREPGGAASRERPRLWGVLARRYVPALLLTLFLVNFVGRSFTPILPLQLQSLGVPVARLASATGVLICCYAMAATVSASGFGHATRRLGARALLFASLLSGAALVLPMAAVSSYAGFLCLAVALGLASGGALTLCYTIGGLLVPEAVRTTAFGFFAGAALFGGALSPALAGALARFDLRAIYYLDAGLFALLAAAVWAALPAVAPTGSAAGAAGPRQAQED